MKERTKIEWSQRTRPEKVLIIARIAVSVLIFCSAVLKYLDYWSNALDFAIPMFGVYYLLEMILNWKKDRDLAAFSLIMAIFIFSISCAVFFL